MSVWLAHCQGAAPPSFPLSSYLKDNAGTPEFYACMGQFRQRLTKIILVSLCPSSILHCPREGEQFLCDTRTEFLKGGDRFSRDPPPPPSLPP